jgi:hypothetical protein
LIAETHVTFDHRARHADVVRYLVDVVAVGAADWDGSLVKFGVRAMRNIQRTKVEEYTFWTFLAFDHLLPRLSKKVFVLAMDRDDEYRRQVAEAQAWADRTVSAVDKESWLRIAQGWLALIRRSAPTEQENFDAAAKARGTGQDESKGSH